MSKLKNSALRQGMVKRSFGTDFFSTFLTSVVGFLFGTVASILIARAIGPEGKGILALISLASGQAMNFLSLGIGLAIVHYVGSSRVNPRVAASTAFVLSLPLGILAMGVAISILRFILKETSVYLWMMIFISASLSPLSLYSGYLSWIARAEGKIVEISGLNLARTFISFLGILGCFLFVRKVLAILVVMIAADLFFIMLWWVLSNRWGYLPSSLTLARKDVAFQLVTYGLKGHGGTILQSLNYRFDMYIVAYFLSAAQVGIYSVAVGFSELLWMLPNSIGVVLTQRAASRSWEEANRITAVSTRVMLSVLAAGCLVWALIGPFFIPLFYGRAFSDAPEAMLWLLPGIWFLGLWKNLINDICCRRYPLLMTYSSGAATVATVILDFILIPRFGIIGAAVASSVAYAIAALTILVPYCRITSARPIELFLLKKGDVKSVWFSVFQAMKLLRGGPKV